MKKEIIIDGVTFVKTKMEEKEQKNNSENTTFADVPVRIHLPTHAQGWYIPSLSCIGCDYRKYMIVSGKWRERGRTPTPCPIMIRYNCAQNYHYKCKSVVDKMLLEL